MNTLYPNMTNELINQIGKVILLIFSLTFFFSCSNETKQTQVDDSEWTQLIDENLSELGYVFKLQASNRL